jgi:hypothetical protein
MKTPMQFLKDEIESKIIPSSKQNGELTDYQYGHNIAYSVVLTLIEHLIEVEKRQIIEAYIAERYVLAGGHPIRIDQAEDYYNRTYNQ